MNQWNLCWSVYSRRVKPVFYRDRLWNKTEELRNRQRFVGWNNFRSNTLSGPKTFYCQTTHWFIVTYVTFTVRGFGQRNDHHASMRFNPRNSIFNWDSSRSFVVLSPNHVVYGIFTSGLTQPQTFFLVVPLFEYVCESEVKLRNQEVLFFTSLIWRVSDSKYKILGHLFNVSSYTNNIFTNFSFTILIFY